MAEEHEAKPGPAQRAEEWVDEHTTPEGNRPKGLEDVEGTPTPAELRRQQQREMEHVGLGTSSQFKGATFGTVAGGVIGAVVIGIIGWLVLSDLDTGLRIGLPLIVGAAAGAAAGFVYWGGRTPELENETMTASGEPQIGSTPRDPGTDERGR